MGTVEKEEKGLDKKSREKLALEFKKAITAGNIAEVERLCDHYNPHYLFAKMDNSEEFPWPTNVVSFVRNNIAKLDVGPFEKHQLARLILS